MNTEILVIVDRSGSMASTASDAIGGYNTFITQQRRVAGQARVTFVQFDDLYEVAYVARPLADVPVLDAETFVPRGSTALLDAIGKTLSAQGERINAERWAESVIVCIVTDGQENASGEFTRQRVRELIGSAEARGWQFVYLGANQDAFQVSRDLGMAHAVVADYAPTGTGTRDAFETVSTTVGFIRRRRHDGPEDDPPPKV